MSDHKWFERAQWIPVILLSLATLGHVLFLCKGSEPLAASTKWGMYLISGCILTVYPCFPLPYIGVAQN